MERIREASQLRETARGGAGADPRLKVTNRGSGGSTRFPSEIQMGSETSMEQIHRHQPVDLDL